MMLVFASGLCKSLNKVEYGWYTQVEFDSIEECTLHTHQFILTVRAM